MTVLSLWWKYFYLKWWSLYWNGVPGVGTGVGMSTGGVQGMSTMDETVGDRPRVLLVYRNSTRNNPDGKVHGTNMGHTWGRQDPGGPHVGPMNFIAGNGCNFSFEKFKHMFYWYRAFLLKLSYREYYIASWMTFKYDVIIVYSYRTTKCYVLKTVNHYACALIVRRAGLLWSQQDFEWLWSVPLSSASPY